MRRRLWSNAPFYEKVVTVKKYKNLKILLAFLKICGIILLVFDTRV